MDNLDNKINEEDASLYSTSPSADGEVSNSQTPKNNDIATEQTPADTNAQFEQSPAVLHSTLEPETVETPVSIVKKKSPFLKYLIIVMAVGIGLSALISIIAVLIGEWNDVVWRALGTNITMMVHSIIAIAVMSSLENESDTKSQKILANIAYGIVIASFFTFVLNIWGIIAAVSLWGFLKLYIYGLILCLLSIRFVGASQAGGIVKYLSLTTVGVATVTFFYSLPDIALTISSSSFITVGSALPELYYRGFTALIIALFASLMITVLTENFVKGRNK